MGSHEFHILEFLPIGSDDDSITCKVRAGSSGYRRSDGAIGQWIAQVFRKRRTADSRSDHVNAESFLVRHKAVPDDDHGAAEEHKKHELQIDRRLMKL